MRIMPYWGDPFCAAYTTAWSPFYESRSGDPAIVEVGWDALPKVVKGAIRARHEGHARKAD
jgi:hypothetical protein